MPDGWKIVNAAWRLHRDGGRLGGRWHLLPRVIAAFPQAKASRRPSRTSRSSTTSRQNFHVRHRLQRYRAGRCMDYQNTGPADITPGFSLSVTELPGAPTTGALVAGLGRAWTWT
jgi:hypothetical protein